MESKKVSVILPVYNGAEYISEAINSIKEQTYSNWELIIVNDCSTDNTLEICHSFAKKDSRIKVISNEYNLKLPKTLNVGFSNATGDYYTWTSDDNIYKPNAFTVLVSALENNPDVAMVYSNFINIDSDGKEIARMELQDPQYIVTDNVFGACFLYTSDIARKVGEYDANLFLAEDYDYWMRVYRSGRVIHIKDYLYLYRSHGGSLTETKKASIQEQTYKAIEKNFLPLYVDAKRNGLSYAFFDHILIRAKAHVNETKDMLLLVDEGYQNFIKRRETIATFKARIKKLYIYKLLKK